MMSGRQLLPRLLQRAARHVSTNTTHQISHPAVPCNYLTKAWVLYGHGFAVSEGRRLSTCNLFSNTASNLAPGYRLPIREVGFNAAGLTQVQQRRTMATKLKRTKIKAYSSYKKRFRGMANGEYKRWRSGKRHNAHSKTNKQKRQLRRPSIAPLALAKVMKKLNFLG